jgi:hypothetical protein
MMILGVLALAFSTSSPSSGPSSSPSVGDVRTCLQPPVSSAITKRFDPPACPYCAGHRTVDFAASPGDEVRAPVSGTVTFVGSVAGERYITIAPATITPSRSARPTDSSTDGDQDVHGDQNILVTVGGAEPDVEIDTGGWVEAGERIATATSDPIRLSLRRIVAGGPAEYLDPEPAVIGWKAPVRLVLEPGSRSPSRIVTRTWTCRLPVTRD